MTTEAADLLSPQHRFSRCSVADRRAREGTFVLDYRMNAGKTQRTTTALRCSD